MIQHTYHLLSHLEEGQSYIHQPAEVRQYIPGWEAEGLVRFHTCGVECGWYLTARGRTLAEEYETYEEVSEDEVELLDEVQDSDILSVTDTCPCIPRSPTLAGLG
jgi:hypothetical protein